MTSARGLANARGSAVGGNQQKLIVAREFQREPKLVIAAQPTRGVDVAQSSYSRASNPGARPGAGRLAHLLRIEEILSLSDRILVMFEGRIVGNIAEASFRAGIRFENGWLVRNRNDLTADEPALS